MDIKDILLVGLTAEDFDLLIKGIDTIVPGEAAGELIMDALVSHTFGNDRNKIARYQAEMKARSQRQKAEKDRLSEDLVLLKSKLIQLKRLLSSNEAVKMANDILSTPRQ